MKISISGISDRYRATVIDTLLSRANFILQENGSDRKERERLNDAGGRFEMEEKEPKSKERREIRGAHGASNVNCGAQLVRERRNNIFGDGMRAIFDEMETIAGGRT